MNISENLNDAQKKAVTFGEGPLLIVAGAGTGKTTVITQRIAWLILEKKLKTDSILALTFTDKAAGEMEERIDVALPYGYVDLWVSTFHAFCERILKDNALEIGLPPDFKLLNQVDQALLVREQFDRFNLDYYRPLGNPTKFIQALVKHFSRAKDENILPQDYLEYAKNVKLDRDQAEFLKKKEGERISEKERIQEVADAYHVYQQLLLEKSSLDFGDLILYAIKLLKERPNVLKRYQEQFAYILVDEFQDTNHAQYELIKLLAAPKNNVTVVGDDDQSIYKFRGAAISNILEFKKDFPNSQEIVLTENYRSKQNILDLAYKFIQLNNPNRLEYQLSHGHIDPKGRPLQTKISKQLHSTTGDAGLIEHMHFRGHTEEASGVVKKILDLKRDDPKLTWSDFSILVRANSYASDFLAVLRRYDVPYHFLASSGLYSQPEVMDIIAYLKMLDNYHESASLWRVLNFPHWQLPHKDLIEFSRYASRRNVSLYDAMKIGRSLQSVSQETLKKIDDVLGMIEKHTAFAKQKTVGQVGLQFMQDSGYLQHLTENQNQENLDKIMHLNQFFRKIEQFESNHDDKSVHSFLKEFEMMQEAGEEGALLPPFEEGPDAVKLMTLHSAKGLEFSYVFLVNLVDKRFPSVERKEPIELPEALIKEIIPEGDVHLQEERRLFYVGMTRAKQALFFTSADDYGGTRKKRPSRFLVELGFQRKEGTEEVDFSERLRQPEQMSRQEVSYVEFLRKSIPEKASFTQIRAFETCPKQYKYAHIFKIPVEGRFTFSFGKSVHNTLFRFFKLVKERATNNQASLFSTSKAPKSTQPIVTLEELLVIYENAWIPDWYESSKHQEEYQRKGKQQLQQWYLAMQGKFPVPVHLEKSFNVKIGERLLKGVIDRIDPVGENGEVEIIDYKTGAVPKGGKLEEDDKRQLFIYDLAVRDVLGLKPKNLTYHYLEGNQLLSFASDPATLEETREYLTQTVEAIHGSTFAATPGYWCKTCDFYQICEDRWKG